jgi:deazaflavin-dependent oxidoreductase (nitroreductase family)
LYRISRGRLGRRTIPKATGFPLARVHGDGQVIFLTVPGRKSGTPRTNPLVAVPIDDGWIVAASFGGSDRNPDWYLNLIAAPVAQVSADGRNHVVTHQLVDDDDTDEAWQQLDAAFGGFRHYRLATTRTIPLIRLVRAPAETTA